LGIIVAISALKDGLEDLKRHKSDNEENNRKVILSLLSFSIRYWCSKGVIFMRKSGKV